MLSSTEDRDDIKKQIYTSKIIDKKRIPPEKWCKMTQTGKENETIS